jgi:hypothetical protein
LGALPVLAVTALVPLIGRAALASNSVSATTGGYGTGTTVQNVSYTFSADGATITGATLTLTGDRPARSSPPGSTPTP